MKNDDWEKVKAIFLSLKDLTPELRLSFLEEACANDSETRREVESLLASHDDAAEGFLETPAVGEVADVIYQAKNLEPGKRFGHYEIIEQIGGGGMGEVYLAEDKKLNRLVAVKIISERYADHESSLKRFIQEARAVSALNHPNILVIHEIGENENTHYIVSEFIKGKTLAVILKERSLKLADVLNISIQIASALCAAHEANLVHRDIKPENVMIRADGIVKVLDFGLAKLIEQNASGFETSSFKHNQTAKGMVLGTANYMSPEQAKGEKLDARTDIFSFGIVMSEMLTGQHPFRGETINHTIVAILEKEPLPLSAFIKDFPVDIERIVKKCLAKNLQARYGSSNELLADLKALEKRLEFESALERTSAPNRKTNTETPRDSNITRRSNEITGSPESEILRPQSSFSVFKSLKLLSFLILIFAFGGGFFAYRYFYTSIQINTNLPASAQVFRYYITFEPETLDPHLVNGSTESNIVTALFDGLTESNVTGRSQPSLAIRWEVNQDATVWIFHLRPEAKWSDGSSLTARDFVYSWKRGLSPGFQSSGSSFLYLIKNAREYSAGKTQDLGVRTIDDHTLEVTLTEPTANFDRLLILPVFRPVPRQAIERWGAKLWTMPEHIVTSGAFKIVDKKPEELILEKNPLFWDNANTRLNQIVFKYSADKDADRRSQLGLQLYEQEEADALSPVRTVPEELFIGRKDIFTSFSGTDFLVINLKVKPLDDVRVRKALSLAINRDQLVKVNRLSRQPATTLVPPLEGYEGVLGIAGNVETARQLLSEAGFSQGRGFPKIEYVYNKSETDKKTAEFMQENWLKELGIEVQLTEQDFRTFRKNRADKKFNGLILGNWTPDYHDAHSYLQTLTSKDYYGHIWINAKYDEILQRANKEMDADRRSALLREAESFMLEQMPVIPLTFRTETKLCKPYVRNFTINSLNQVNLRSLYIKK